MRRLLFAIIVLASTMPAHAGIALRAATQSFEVGSGSFFYCFFSTVSANLEPGGWGSRFPILMKLYQGGVALSDLALLRKELVTAQSELRKLPPSKVVWDFEHRDRQPPWGNNINASITNLSTYFVTSNGKDLFEVLLHAVAEAERVKAPIEVE
jgi:hypothetical protein